jgi:hypothetical protein
MHKKLLIFYFLLLNVESMLAKPSDQAFEIDTAEYEYLNKLAVGHTDKAVYHNYMEIYSMYFKEIKEKPLKFLEIGIFRGGSLFVWENYFKHAEIHGLDSTFDYLAYKFDRAICHKANQSNPEELLQVVKDCGGNFDIILDDGGHLMTEQIISFTTLFPHLNSGGLYIIEDLHTSYWKEFGGSGTRQYPNSEGNTTITFLKSLIDSVNYVGAATGRANHIQDLSKIEEFMDIYTRDILGIHFYDSICIIIKR